MNVSITPTRDALNLLGSQGLLRIIPNKGAMVEIFTFRDLIEIYDLRKQFESLAITYISKIKNNKFILNKLDEICKKDLDALKKNNIEFHVNYINEFHDILIRSAGSKRLIKFYNEIYLQSAFLVKSTIKFTKKPIKSVIEHKNIIKAISENKTNYAIKLVNYHVENVKNDILKEVRRLLEIKNDSFNLDTRIDIVG